MKKIILLLFLFCAGISNATTWGTSFEDAKKLALATNRFIIVDFWATWCGPCKKMDRDSWDNQEVKMLLENYVAVKIDIDQNRDIASNYGIQSIPNMFILDAYGKVVYSFSGYHDPMQLKKELEKFALSTEYFAIELINKYKNPGYNTSTRLSQKYFDYSMYVDKGIKSRIVDVSMEYLKDAKQELKKDDPNFEEKLQKLKLLELYEFAYKYNFSKLSKKLADFTEKDVHPNNFSQYYFLKLVAAKGNLSPELADLEAKGATIENFEAHSKKADLLLTKA